MQTRSKLRNRLLAATALVLVLTSVPTPAHAVSKEMVALETQVQQLMDMVQRLQSTLDARLGVLQHMAEQTADNANQVTATVNALQQKLATQNDAVNGKMDTASGQVQALNDSVDELKSRIAKLDKSVQDLQAQIQSAQNPAVGSTPAPVPNAAPNAAPNSAPFSAPAQSAPSAGPAAAPGTSSARPAPPSAGIADQNPPLNESFQAAVRDYNAAKYDVATEEFQDVIHFYPLDDLAGQAQFYLGEIAYSQLRLTDAVRSYNAVLEGFPGSSKAPAAQLRKGLALLQMKDRRDAAIHEFRVLVQRHPQTPEAAQARAKLASLGAKPTGR
jgi:TolA-binding protein